MAFNEQQKKAIYAPIDKNVLISAGAGSGKTATLTERVYEVIKNKGIKPSRLVVLTFTENAAHEMKERMIGRFKEDQELQDQISSSHIQTFDSFMGYLVKRYSFRLGISANYQIINDKYLQVVKRKIIDDVLNEYYCNLEKKPIIFALLKLFDTSSDENIIKIIDYLVTEISKLPYDKQDVVFNHYQEHFLSDDFMMNITRFVYYRSHEESTETEDDSDIKIDKNNIYYRYSKQIIDLLDIVKLVIMRILEEKKRINQYEYQDITFMATSLLLEEKYADIKKEIGEMFDYIMVDEYQDTNDFQEVVLNEIVKVNPRIHLFLVGDQKQSIYGFRDAKVELFRKRMHDFKKNGDLVILMNTNYRSRKQVIEDVNNIFNEYMTISNGEVDYKNDNLDSPYDKDTYDYGVKRLLLEVKNDDGKVENVDKCRLAERKAILADIINKVNNKFMVYDRGEKEYRPVRYSDFAILMRKKSSFADYKNLFEANGVSLNVKQDTEMSDADCVNVLTSLLRYINMFITDDETNDQNNYYLASVLRSYLYRYKDQEISDLFSNYQDNQVYLFIKDFADKHRDSPIDQLFLDIINEFKVVEKLYLEGDIEANITLIESLYQVALSVQDNGSTLNDLIEMFDNYDKYDLKFNTELVQNDANSVNLMTIHASKGLEFKIVYLPVSDNSDTKGRTIDGLMAEFMYEAGLALDDYSRITELEGEEYQPIDTVIHQYIKYKKQDNKINEYVRLLYVAMTRGEDLVYLVGDRDYYPQTKKYGINDMLDNVNIQTEPATFDFAKTKQEKKKIEVDKLVVDDTYVEFKEVIKKRASKQLDTDKEEQMVKVLDYGTKLHLLLELTDLKTKDTSLIKEDEERKIIDNVLKNELLADLEDAVIYKEYGYFDKELNTTGFIDLFYQKNGIYYIIDYKTKNIYDPNYHNQLHQYERNVRELFGVKGDKVKLYLLSIIDNKVLEVEPMYND